MMKVLVAGDFAPKARLAEQIEETKFPEIFSKEVCAIIRSADFSFVNLESPVTEDGYRPIPKCGPNLHCTPMAVDAIKYAGFTCATMANNHILDFGADGLRKTVCCCQSRGLNVVGAGDNLDGAGRVLYLEKDGKRLAVINCCEHEFSVATETSAGANPLNPIRQFYSIQEAKKNSDFVLVIVHGGHEHYQLPSPRMVETYRFFIEVGADAVVNHHQHCFSGYEIYRGKPIFYGIGNFCFDIFPARVDAIWNYGYMVELSFGDNVDYRLMPYNQYGRTPTIELVACDSFDAKIKELNAIISNETELKNHIEKYYGTCEKIENLCLEPYSSRVMSKLFIMGLVPSFIKGKKAAFVLNHVECEAHRDKILFALKRKKQ